jgi:hypothetical protein
MTVGMVVAPAGVLVKVLDDADTGQTIILSGFAVAAVGVVIERRTRPDDV